MGLALVGYGFAISGQVDMSKEETIKFEKPTWYGTVFVFMGLCALSLAAVGIYTTYRKSACWSICYILISIIASITLMVVGFSALYIYSTV